MFWAKDFCGILIELKRPEVLLSDAEFLLNFFENGF